MSTVLLFTAGFLQTDAVSVAQVFDLCETDPALGSEGCSDLLKLPVVREQKR